MLVPKSGREERRKLLGRAETGGVTLPAFLPAFQGFPNAALHRNGRVQVKIQTARPGPLNWGFQRRAQASVF